MQEVKDFLAEKKLALAGMSRNDKSFSAAVYKELGAKGYTLYPINPNAETIAGTTCYPNISALPEQVGGVLILTQPAVTAQVVRDAAAAGIDRIWIQQGAESKEAIDFCKEKNLKTVTGQCILMFAEPVASFHGFHRWLKKVFGRLPH